MVKGQKKRGRQPRVVQPGIFSEHALELPVNRSQEKRMSSRKIAAVEDQVRGMLFVEGLWTEPFGLTLEVKNAQVEALR